MNAFVAKTFANNSTRERIFDALVGFNPNRYSCESSSLDKPSLIFKDDYLDADCEVNFVVVAFAENCFFYVHMTNAFFSENAVFSVSDTDDVIDEKLDDLSDKARAVLEQTQYAELLQRLILIATTGRYLRDPNIKLDKSNFFQL